MRPGSGTGRDAKPEKYKHARCEGQLWDNLKGQHCDEAFPYKNAVPKLIRKKRCELIRQSFNHAALISSYMCDAGAMPTPMRKLEFDPFPRHYQVVSWPSFATATV